MSNTHVVFLAAFCLVSCGNIGARILGPKSPDMYEQGCQSLQECSDVLQLALKEADMYECKARNNGPTCKSITKVIRKVTKELNVRSSQEYESVSPYVTNCLDGDIGACAELKEIRLKGGRFSDLYDSYNGINLEQTVCRADAYKYCHPNGRRYVCNIPDAMPERNALCAEIMSFTLDITTADVLSSCGEFDTCLDACSMITDKPLKPEACDFMCHTFAGWTSNREICEHEKRN